MRLRSAIAFIAALLAMQGAHAQSITIGAGPVLGQDHDFPPNVFNQEFQDWTAADVRYVHPVSSTSPRYNVFDGNDDGRDIMAFYSRMDTTNFYMRADFFDLAAGSENSMNIYVAIDCGAGGNAGLPDGVSCNWDRSWDLCLAVYAPGTIGGTNYNYYRATGGTFNGVDYLGSYWNATLDSVEFGVSRQSLVNAGWDGSSPVHMTVYTTKDFFDVPAASDLLDCIPDHDRGFSDGTVNGSINSATPFTGRAKWASIAHGNQSVNQGDDTRVHIFDPSNAFKTGFIRALDTHEIFNVPINLHLSGSLIVASLWAEANPAGNPATTETPLSDGPDFLARVGQFIDANQSTTPGALIGGVTAEHIMPYFEGAVNVKSMQLFNELMFETWGLTTAEVPVMHTPERVIRSRPTGGSPLTGFTFPDILAGGYLATYLDEVTHYHWWFDSGNTTWTGQGGTDVSPNEHKIQLVNGVYCFLINDREDQSKFGNDDGGAMKDTRFTLTEKARHADQAQLTLVFDDWEAMAGKSFDVGSGSPVANNNQDQYQNTVRWLANHQWIEIVTLNEILDRATDTGHAQYNAAWVVDRGVRTDLTTQTYEWLKRASELSYHYWYYNSDIEAGGSPTGNEQNFFNLVPVITGEQGDYHRRMPSTIPTDSADANAKDLAAGSLFIPSGKIHGDLNTPGTLMADTWASITSAPNNRARRLAEWTFVNMIYETAWHEEQAGSYSNTTFQNPFPSPDGSWDGLNTWALRLHNHIRKAHTLAIAAQWAEEVRTATQGATTVVQSVDVDFDGENEYVLKNDKVWAVFERYGGRMTYAFVYDTAVNDAYCVIGSAIANPSEPGEEERVGTGANRCSAFKEMNSAGGAVLADAAQTSITPLGNGFQFVITAGATTITKTISLASGSNGFDATYNVSGLNSGGGGTRLYTRFGVSPNNLDLILHGPANLTTSSTSTTRGVANSAGGSVVIENTSGGAVLFNDTPADAGWDLRNLAQSHALELSGPDNSTYTFTLRLVGSGTAVNAWDLY